MLRMNADHPPPLRQSLNPLARAGGCPMARHPSSSDSQPMPIQQATEPPDNDRLHFVPPATSSSSSSSSLSSSSGLSAEGELTPPGLIPAANLHGNSPDGRYWVNPSANALYRALDRKQKGIHSDDAASVSMVHNAVTENTWSCIMEYEEAYQHSCPQPTLARFYGMDGIYSIKARFFHRIMGAPLPFDRHDWIIDRCGRQVRYIIDYYSIEEDEENGGTVSYNIDARPAPTISGLMDRGRMAFHKWRKGEQWF